MYLFFHVKNKKNSTWLEKRKEHDQVLDDRQCKGTGIRNIPDIVGL